MQGLPIVNYGWWGVCARSGVPQPVIEIVNRHVVAAIATSEYRAVIEKLGVIPLSSTPEEFGRVIADTVKEATGMFRELGIERIE